MKHIHTSEDVNTDSGPEVPYTDLKKRKIPHARHRWESSVSFAYDRVPSQVTWRRGFAALFGALLIFTGICAASLNSVPGSIWYPVKTSITEEIIGLTKLSEAAQLVYANELLKKRLDETHDLVQENALTATAVETLEIQVAKHLQTIETVLDADTDQSLRTNMVLTTTAEAKSVVDAVAYIVAQYSAGVIEQENTFVEVQSYATNLRTSAIETFVANRTTKEIYTFVELQLVDITPKIDAQSTTTASQIEEHLTTASIALAADEFTEALASLSDAMQLLSQEEYLGGLRESVSQ